MNVSGVFLTVHDIPRKCEYFYEADGVGGSSLNQSSFRLGFRGWQILNDLVGDTFA
jgi:hypothetical protein